MGADFISEKITAAAGNCNAARLAWLELCQDLRYEAEDAEGYSGTFYDTDDFTHVYDPMVSTVKEFHQWVVDHGKKGICYAFDVGDGTWAIAAYAPT